MELRALAVITEYAGLVRHKLRHLEVTTLAGMPAADITQLAVTT
jgi:hypothetical protein